MHIDRPKLLKDTAARAARLGQIHEPHVAPLTQFVMRLREQMGERYSIPYFDPWDGGVKAEVLLLMEAPGPKAVASGFVSRNNPDESAKNLFEIQRDAGIPREKTVLWNIVPWYIGTGTKIRPAEGADIEAGTVPLIEMLTLLPSLRAIVLVGGKAQRVKPVLSQHRPDLELFACHHPSPMFVNNAPGNRERILMALRGVAERLADAPTHRSAG